MVPKTCSIDGCSTKHYARGWCKFHYQRWHNHGDPLIVKSVHYPSKEEAFEARTDWQGDCLVWTGATDSSGYGHMRFGRKITSAHRYAWERINGPIPDGMTIDHRRCYNPVCVLVDHLRLTTKAQNNYNRSGPQTASGSGVRNVHRSRGKWKVLISKGGHHFYFGVYATIEEASIVAERERRKLFGEFAGRG